MANADGWLLCHPTRLPSLNQFIRCALLPRSAPTLAVKATTQTGATVEVTHPAIAPDGGWASLSLNVCLKSNPTTCPIEDQGCPASSGKATNCTLGGLLGSLLPATEYNVEVRSCWAFSEDGTSRARHAGGYVVLHAATKRGRPLSL